MNQRQIPRNVLWAIERHFRSLAREAHRFPDERHAGRAEAFDLVVEALSCARQRKTVTLPVPVPLPAARARPRRPLMADGPGVSACPNRRCPTHKSGEDERSYDNMESEGCAWQNVECGACGAQWQEIYELTRVNPTWDGGEGTPLALVQGYGFTAAELWPKKKANVATSPDGAEAGGSG